MPKITITIEGDASQLRGVLEGILNGIPSQDFPEVGEPSPDGFIPNAPLTRDEVRYFWDDISQQAQIVLLEVAQRPKGYPFGELATKLRVDGRTLGGRLSSIGFAMNRNGVPREKNPIIRDTRGGELIYRMHPDVAEEIKRRAHDEGLSGWDEV